MCAILQPKLDMKDEEKRSIAKDVTAAYDKTHLTLDDDQQLRILVSIINCHIMLWVSSLLHGVSQSKPTLITLYEGQKVPWM